MTDIRLEAVTKRHQFLPFADIDFKTPMTGVTLEVYEATARELRDIRQEKRASLESEIGRVRFSTLWLMPSLVFGLGMVLLYRRKRNSSHTRSAS